MIGGAAAPRRLAVQRRFQLRAFSFYFLPLLSIASMMRSRQPSMS